MVRARVWFVLALMIGTAPSSSRAVENNARMAALLSITAAEIKDHVGTLADDTFEGRESGSRGNRAAGIYITERLKKFGLRGGGPKDSFYQGFNNYHNILALAEGRDPELKDQVVVISAHYDHVGYGTNRNSFGPIGMIHNGADDNASGVAGLLEIADAVSQLPQKPKRSILFAFWDGEEKGLLGSQYWVDHPTAPLQRVPIMINADMIGRLRHMRLEIFGTRTSRGLRRLISRQNDMAQLSLDFNWDLKADSDHYTFYSHDIPVVMLHTGMHEDYHRPSDDADKINNEGLKQIAQLMFGTLVELADAPNLDGFRQQARQESRGDQRLRERELPPPPGRLGIRWDETAAQAGTIVVTTVTPGSAADKGGLRVGDRLATFAHREIHDVVQLRVSVLAAKNPVAVSVQRPGEATPRELTLELPGQPVRLGISWRTDDAEPGCVIVNCLTPGSPADLAGLKINDRIQRICGQDFVTGDQFRQLAVGAPEPLLLEVESVGRVRTVEIAPVTSEPQSPPPAGETPLPPIDPGGSDN